MYHYFSMNGNVFWIISVFFFIYFGMSRISVATSQVNCSTNVLEIRPELSNRAVEFMVDVTIY